MSDISKIILYNQDYDIKDKKSREKIQISTVLEPTPQENTELLINLNEAYCINVPEVKDNIVSKDDTWSSHKIYDELQHVYYYLQDNPPVTYEDYTLGLCADFENNTFTRLEKAIDSQTQEPADFNTFSIYNKRRRCNVSDDGHITAFFGEMNYTEDGSNGQVMVIQPKFYYRVEPLKIVQQTGNGQGYHLYKANYYISDKPQTGFSLHPAFFDNNGRELEYYLIGAFDGYSYNNKWSSIANVEPTCDITRGTIESRAQARGITWHNCDIKIWSAEQLLMIIEFGSFNMQNAIGGGILNGSKTATGQTRTSGTVKTASDNYTDPICYRGVENPWGNVSKWFNGVNVNGNGSQNGGIPYIAEGRTYTDDTTVGYKSAGFTLTNSDGYVKYFGYNKEFDWLFMCSLTGGNSSVPVGDYNYVTGKLNRYRVVSLAGRWINGASSAPRSGAFCWAAVNASSYVVANIGGRLAEVPLATSQSYLDNLLLI